MVGKYDVICLQEHKATTQEQLCERSDQMRKLGWASTWSLAIAGPKGGAQAGVAILVREDWGMHSADVITQSRAIAAVVDVPRGGRLGVVSLYLVDSIGLGPRNKANKHLLASLGQWAQRRVHPWVLAGDWNLTPSMLAVSGLPVRVGGRAIATSRATCIQRKSTSIIDYGMVSQSRARHSSAQLREDFASAPHRPVEIMIEMPTKR